jgi:hypothetical protein
MRIEHHILNIRVFCNVMLCLLINTEVSETVAASVFVIRGASGSA